MGRRKRRVDRRRKAAGALAVWLAAVAVVLAAVVLVPIGGRSDPFEGARLYVDPHSGAKRQAEEWRATRPEDAALMDKISAVPTAQWFSGDEQDVRAEVDEQVVAIREAGALPVLVAYNIPNRDCGGVRPGNGAISPEDYAAWIRDFASGLGGREAAVVLEPDALPMAGCLTEDERRERFALLTAAVEDLEAQGDVAVYLDAGHPGWVSAPVMADRLSSAGIAEAEGFSLNVANFQRTRDNITFGREISSRLDGEHFVVDTSRNGLGPAPDGQSCNPPERALGGRPTARTADPLVDAYLWIKPPGESDGACNGGPPAGVWWADYAVGLAQRAAYRRPHRPVRP